MQPVTLPNVKRIFSPDPGYIYFDLDLSNADVYVVAWEANDEGLKNALRQNLDLHLDNARVLFDLPLSQEELIKGSDANKLAAKKYKTQRDLTKRFVHGTNYGGSARTMAINCSISVAESEKNQARWFTRRPGIRLWHERTARALRTTRTVANRFGYRRVYFERPDSVLPEALAWVPQSTVANVINLIWCAIDDALPHVQIQAQVHDSLAGQFPVQGAAQTILDIQALAAKIFVPYPDPLNIPISIKTSQISWGDCG